MGKREAFCAENLRALAILLFASAAVLMVCSMNSWLYSFNPCTDVNIISTVGRGMFDGLVPYRDLVEQKGPLLFALFGLGEMLVPGTYHGIYVLEALFVAGALFFGWKTIRLYLPGLSPILWTKFNLLGFHFVWMAAVAIDALVKEKKLWPPVKMCLIFLGGMAIATLPWLIYFGANGALGIFIQSYLTDNIFRYALEGGERYSALYNIARWVYALTLQNPLYMALLAVAGVSVLAFPRARMAVREKAMLVAAALMMAALMFSRGYYMAYYSVFLASYLPFALLPLAALRGRIRIRWPRWAMPAAAAAVIAASVGFGYENCGESQWIGVPYDSTPQAQVAEAVENSGVEDPTMLNYHLMDSGFYFASGAEPADRWFTVLNIRQDECLPRMDELVDERAMDFIVTIVGDPEQAPEFEGYDVVLSFSSDFGLEKQAYYTLYQREGAV